MQVRLHAGSHRCTEASAALTAAPAALANWMSPTAALKCRASWACAHAFGVGHHQRGEELLNLPLQPDDMYRDLPRSRPQADHRQTLPALARFLHRMRCRSQASLQKATQAICPRGTGTRMAVHRLAAWPGACRCRERLAAARHCCTHGHAPPAAQPAPASAVAHPAAPALLKGPAHSAALPAERGWQGEVVVMRVAPLGWAQ